MADLVFFYGTLMTGFDRRRQIGIDPRDAVSHAAAGCRRRCSTSGIYPAAVPAEPAACGVKCSTLLDPEACCRRSTRSKDTARASPTAACTSARRSPVHLPDGTTEQAWVYFYNAPLGKAPRIDSGDYLEI